jgi:hypothetical protein
MNEKLISKQDQIKEFQIIPNTYRKHNPTSELHISPILNCYAGPIGGSFGRDCYFS